MRQTIIVNSTSTFRHIKTDYASQSQVTWLCEATIHNEWTTAAADSTHVYNGYSGSAYLGLLGAPTGHSPLRISPNCSLMMVFSSWNSSKQAATICSSCNHLWIYLFKAFRRWSRKWELEGYFTCPAEQYHAQLPKPTLYGDACKGWDWCKSYRNTRNAGVDKHLEGWRQYRSHW